MKRTLYINHISTKCIIMENHNKRKNENGCYCTNANRREYEKKFKKRNPGILFITINQNGINWTVNFIEYLQIIHNLSFPGNIHVLSLYYITALREKDDGRASPKESARLRLIPFRTLQNWNRKGMDKWGRGEVGCI